MFAEQLDAFEVEESGQLAIGVEGEQRSLDGLAAPGKPAPVEPTGLYGAEEELQARAAFAEAADEDEHQEPAEPGKRTPSRREYRCGDCERKLPHERWIYSRHTGARYCVPGEGCQTPEAYTKQERARERARKEG